MIRHFRFLQVCCFLLLLAFTSPCVMANTAAQFKKRVNLALRQTGHHLLLSQCDSTSSIPSVRYYGVDGFLLPLKGILNYDTLPTLLEQAFQDYNISAAYELSILNCETGIPLLGYNTAALVREEIPCMGRDQIATCGNIFVQFTKRESSINGKTPLLAWLLIPIIGGLGFLFFKKITPAVNPAQAEDYFVLGQYQFDPKNQLLINREEQIQLTFRENKLLLFFARHPNEVLNRADILSAVWEDEGVIVGRSLDVFISRLRKRLNTDPSVQIKNIHGVGYKLDLPIPYRSKVGRYFGLLTFLYSFLFLLWHEIGTF